MFRKFRPFIRTVLRGGLVGIASALGARTPGELAEIRRPSSGVGITAIVEPRVRAPASWRAKKGVIRELPGLLVLFENDTNTARLRRGSEQDDDRDEAASDAEAM